jgi:hypothetical protein
MLVFVYPNIIHTDFLKIAPEKQTEHFIRAHLGILLDQSVETHRQVLENKKCVWVRSV